jgi:hypothetical protein
LVQHFYWLAEGRPSTSVWAVHMAGSIDIWSRLVDLAVYDEARSIDGAFTTTDSISVFINSHHIGHLQHAEMYTVRIDPECIRLNRVYKLLKWKNWQTAVVSRQTSKADVSAAAIRKA